MFSLETIRSMNERAARKAKGKRPFVLKSMEQLKRFPPFPFPNFGDYRPEGWVLVETWFVDSSGFGEDDEPALSVRQFLNKLVVGHGYAVIEAGQFQVYVGEFAKEGSEKGKTIHECTQVEP